MRVGDVDLGKAMIHGPEVGDWPATIHHDYKGSFATNEIDEELEEGVNGKGLI